MQKSAPLSLASLILITVMLNVDKGFAQNKPFSSEYGVVNYADTSSDAAYKDNGYYIIYHDDNTDGNGEADT
ncbi:MAG: hypothetical protein RI519_07175, partial [Balneolaceae bacterium]|nr:hypothetical protein [Balneolaceae bacterium]